MEEIIISQEAGKIICDFEAAKASLEAELANYQGLVFTEDTKKDAKNTVANLRKCKKAFEDKCKSIKKEYMRPCDEFMTKAGILSDMFDTPICFINDQINAFEEKRKEEKKAAINDIYAELVGEFQEYLPLHKIYNPRWENDTFTIKEIKAEILTKKEEIKKGLDLINALPSDEDIKNKAITCFISNHDLADAMQMITSYEKQKAEILARNKEKEEEAIRQDERRRISEESHTANLIEAAKEDAREELISSLMPKAEEGEEEEVYVYNIFLTSDAKEKLETYMDSVGITFSLRTM